MASIVPATLPGPAGVPAEPTVVAVVAHARRVPSADREAFAQRLRALPPSEGAIVVHTCHRVEYYVAPGSRPGPLPPAPRGSVVLDDADAASHLIAVACGLDSAVLGEDQILHQLRETIANRHESADALDPVLERLFQAALHAGRQAHAWFGGTSRSLAEVALERIEAAVGPVAGHRVLVVGAGSMGRLAAQAAARRGARLAVTNRSSERAEALARELGGEALPFGSDDTVGPTVGVIVAIGGPWTVGRRDATRLAEAAVPVVDLSSPTSVPAELRLGLGPRFTSVDDLAAPAPDDPTDRLRRRLEKLVSDTGRHYCRWLRTRDAVPAIQAMASSAEDHRRAELAWLERRLPELSPEELAIVEQMSHRLVAAILHAPLAALNADADGELERAARELFAL